MLTITIQKHKTNGVNVDNNSINVCNNGETETETETETITKLNQTKLNLYFNYIYNIDQNYEGISEAQKQGIINCMKRLDIFLQNLDGLKYLNKVQIQEMKIQYWVIKELYFSPYAVYLNKLSMELFLNKYLLTQKYIELNEDNLEDFVNYFIKTLREELKQNST